jgi:hypothetical protein
LEIGTTMRMLTIIPTRGRNDNAIRLFEAINATADFTEVVFAIDADDVKTYQGLMHETAGLENVKVVIAEHMGLNATLNHWALWFAPDYDYICFMGDDHLPRTGGWDTKLAEAIGTEPGIAYGNDLLQGENLPTAVVMSSKIIRATGFMSPPALKHLFLDNYWLAMGHALENVNYLPDVIIEHLHYTNGKAALDDRYVAVNTVEMHNGDQAIFAEYLATEFANDVENVKAW